jgi:hypothetical protein
MVVTGVVIGGIMAGVATLAQHVIIKRQHHEIEGLKKPKEGLKEEQPHDADDFAYLIQGKKPKDVVQQALDNLVQGPWEEKP